MKLGAIVSGLDTRALGANDGGRHEKQVQQDIEDIRNLIRTCQLPRSLVFEGRDVQRAYEIFTTVLRGFIMAFRDLRFSVPRVLGCKLLNSGVKAFVPQQKSSKIVC